MENSQSEESPNDVVPTEGVSMKNGAKVDSSNILMGIVAVLVVMSGVQVFQTNQLIAAISSGTIKASAQPQGGSSVDLPSQVGGCG